MKKVNSVLFVAAEAAPLAKAGGLADVVGSLPKALARLGVDVRILLPKYHEIDSARFPAIKRPEECVVRFDGVDHVIRLFETTLPNSTVPVYLVDHPHYEGAGNIYYQDVTNSKEQQELQVERFLFLSRAVPEILKALQWQPDVVHCHDWHTAATPYFLQTHAHSSDQRPATVYTIHNLPLQGGVSLARFSELTGLPMAELHLPKPAITPNWLNLTALGLATADALTTVSPTYAQEILEPAFGGGLDTVLRGRKDSLVGILNGLDTEIYNPEHDPSVLPFSETNLSTREQNTKRLREKTGLANGPLFGMVTRLTSQKGVDLVCEILPRLVQLGSTVVFLGSGEPQLERQLQGFAKQYPSQVSATIGFDSVFAQQIYAGSDFFLMPSIFEPCGLGQMIAMRYGSIPIVRATGGLKDTVTEGPSGTGFVFSEPKPTALLDACRRALDAREHPSGWQALQKRAMSQDFSWDQPAKKYLRCYQQACQRAHEKK